MSSRCSFLLGVLVFMGGVECVVAGALDDLAEGAVVVATAKLKESRMSAEGEGLLKFALALSPDNKKALILQAKLEESLPLDNVALADGGAQYAAILLKAAQDGAYSFPMRVLFCRVALLVQPENEKALVALAKAKNRGTEVSLDGLLKGLAEGEFKPFSNPPPPTPPPPAAAVGGGANAGAKGADDSKEKPAEKKLFNWDEQRKAVNYFYKGRATGDNACDKLTDGLWDKGRKGMAGYRISLCDDPTKICFSFPDAVKMKTFRIFVSQSMATAVNVYDGTKAKQGELIGQNKPSPNRGFGWVEVTLNMKTPSSFFWVEIVGTQRHYSAYHMYLGVEEIQFVK